MQNRAGSSWVSASAAGPRVRPARTSPCPGSGEQLVGQPVMSTRPSVSVETRVKAMPPAEACSGLEARQRRHRQGRGPRSSWAVSGMGAGDSPPARPGATPRPSAASARGVCNGHPQRPLGRVQALAGLETDAGNQQGDVGDGCAVGLGPSLVLLEARLLEHRHQPGGLGGGRTVKRHSRPPMRSGSRCLLALR